MADARIEVGRLTHNVTLAVVALLLGVSSALAQASLSPGLDARLSLTPAGERVAVYAVLERQASARKLRARLLDEGLSRVARSTAVLGYLKQANQAEQVGLLTELQSRESVGDVRAHWIVNLVAFSASPEDIREIARRPDVRAVNLDLPWEFESAVTSELATAEPDGVERGLRVIKAPAMWARGYTGFGGVALTADTGVDPFHPAIGHKFAGHDGRPTPWFASEDYPVAADCGDHGTHVNGTIMGLDRLTNDTIGVAPGAHWLGGAILCGTGTGDNLGIFEWALDPDEDAGTTDDRPFVINNSWYDPSIGDVECTDANPYPQLLDNLHDAGVAVIFSAGNAGPEPMTITPPHSYNASLTNAFTIGALDGNSAGLPIADFSSRGPATCSPGTEAIDIKPEVSAPGVRVRSCLPGGEYGLKSGTSMAAPHTAGAVLLLHEAFPDLDGDAIVSALYYSARDLGDPGEDNTFGRGIIDVDAAYQYLLDAGNVATPAERPERAVDVVAAAGQSRQCGGRVALAVTVLNTGSVPVTSLGYELEGLSDDPIVRQSEVSAAPGERVDLAFDLETDIIGDRFVGFRLLTINGEPADPRLDLGASWRLELSQATPPALVMDRETSALCLGSPVALTLDSEIDDRAHVHFGEEPDFELLPPGAGERFVLEELTEPVTLYGLNEYQRDGGPSLTVDASELTYVRADTFSIFVRALRSGILRDMTFVLERSSRIAIDLTDLRTGDIVGTYNRRHGAGANRISFTSFVEEGGDYRLDITRATGLGYDPGVSVTDTRVEGFLEFDRVGADDPNVRAGSFFLFDWSVGYYDGCTTVPVTLTPDSTRTASERTIGVSNATPVVGQEFEASDDTPGTGTEYRWRFDGDVIGGEASAVSITPTESGPASVEMRLLDGEGCATAATLDLDVEAAPSSTRETLAPGAYRLWPNPTTTAFSVDGDLVEIARVEVLDALGRVVESFEGAQDAYPVGHLPAGQYIVRLVNEGGASKGFALEVQ